MVQFALDPSFGFNCTAAFDFSELPHAAPLASLCAQHTATSLALGKGLFDFCSYKEGLCNLHAEKWSGAVHVLRRLRRNLLRVTRAAQRHLGARTAVARRLREEVAESGRRAWRWSQCDELMYLTGGELFTHVPVGNLVGCMKRFRESSFASVMQLFHFALWQLPELQDLRPRWIFDRQMMGGENGDGAVSAEGKVSHSYRSFLLVRLLQQLSEAKRHGLVAAELGVMGAHTSEILMQELPELQMILVEPNIVAEARQRVKPFQHRARWLEAMSDVAHQELPDASLDLVFIDGDHRYQTVVDDLRLWSPKVAPGGCSSGCC